jgi:hypothetical protein
VQQERRRDLTGPAVHLVTAAFLVYLGLTLVQVRLGYGVLGVGNPNVPGGFGSLLTLVREQLVPAALLLCLWVFDRRRTQWAQATALMIVVTGVTAAVISTSRGILPSLVAPMLLLWLLTGRLTRPRKMGFIAVALIAVVLFPILSHDRFQRITGSEGKATLPSVSEVADAAFFMVTRPSGVEGVLHGYDHRGTLEIQRTLRFLRPHAMTEYYTRTVVRVADPADFRAPGIVGALMMIGGGPAVVLMMIATVLLIQWLWVLFARLKSWPVALALTAPAVAITVSGGVEFQILVKVVIQVLACEFVYRKFLSRPILSQP